ncbi:MAG TPA: DUF1549 domain-containing protein [Pirellulaceae bacterium]|nr:DUF1549 domain-containing protein [Pirellulaceae bacterium]
MRSRSLVIGLAVCCACPARGVADDLLPAETPVEQAIDHYVGAKLQAAGVTAAAQAEDANVLRRTMLDLVGRIPTPAEAKAYVADPSPDKREGLVERLLASPAFIRQQTAEFDALLMHGTGKDLREYLSKAFSEKRSWDQMFRDMIAGETDDSEQKGAIRFVAARAKDPDKLTNDTSVLFFGVNVSCAKCHDHPLVADWTQDHYYGMFSFFSRTYDVGDFLGEREYGNVNYKTVTGDSRDARLMFLSGTVLDEPPSEEPDESAKKEERKRLEELKKSKQPPPPPAYSRRAQLVDAALEDDENDYFSRAIVNHLWNRFFGRGLVHPVDQMHSENPPSHPELLDWLARDVRARGYDLVPLIRGIALSQTYSRSSQWDSAGESPQEKRPSDGLFAVAQIRPLKPWQYGTLLKLATVSPDRFPADLSADDLDQRIQGLEGGGRGLGSQFEMPTADFQIGIDEALLFSNSERIASELLPDNKESLLGKMADCPDLRSAAETAVWSIYTRRPTEEELTALTEYLAQREDRIADARRQLVWALLTSSECRFNY